MIYYFLIGFIISGLILAVEGDTLTKTRAETIWSMPAIWPIFLTICFIELIKDLMKGKYNE